MPTYKPPTQFPGLDKLPTSVRSMVEMLFPQEPELPTPAGMAAGPFKVIRRAPIQGMLLDPEAMQNLVRRPFLDLAAHNKLLFGSKATDFGSMAKSFGQKALEQLRLPF